MTTPSSTSVPISLGMPEAPPPVLAPRRKTRKIKVGSIDVGGDAPVSVQSMTTTLTSDVNSTLQQIAELTAAGCDIVRVACPSTDDAEALPQIAQHSNIPVIADIHFQPKYVFAAIEAGCAAVRVNPGNIRKFDDQVKQIAQAANDRGTSIRIGVNAGSLDPRARSSSTLAMSLTNEEIEACREAFARFDRDNSGAIDAWELRATLQCAEAHPE